MGQRYYFIGIINDNKTYNATTTLANTKWATPICIVGIMVVMVMCGVLVGMRMCNFNVLFGCIICTGQYRQCQHIQCQYGT